MCFVFFAHNLPQAHVPKSYYSKSFSKVRTKMERTMSERPRSRISIATTVVSLANFAGKATKVKTLFLSISQKNL